MTDGAVARKRADSAAYYARNKEKIAAKAAAKKAEKAEYDRAYRAENAEKIKAAKAAWKKSEVSRAADAAYRKTHAAEMKAYKDAWYAANRERLAAEAKEAHAANPEIRKQKKLTSYHKDAARFRAETRAWAAANPEKKKAADAAYFEANRETVLANVKAWRIANPVAYKLSQARRRRGVRTATPPWADRRALDAIYTEALARNLTVDHVYPLHGKLVSGLHVPANLQLLTRSENCRKSNKFDPEALCL